MNITIGNYTRPPSILETERLLLRAPRLEDALELSELAAADPSFAHNTVGDEDNSLESACTAIVRMLEDRRNDSGNWWIVVEKSTGNTVGLTGYSDRNEGAGPVSALASDYIGRGYLVECIEAIARCGASLTGDREATAMGVETKHESRGSDARWYWRSKMTRSRVALARRCA